MFWKKVTSLEENVKVLEKRLRQSSNNDSSDITSESLSAHKNTVLENSDMSDLSDDSDNDEPDNITENRSENRTENRTENRSEMVLKLSQDFKYHLIELDKKLENNISKYNLEIEQQNNKYNTLIQSLNESKNVTTKMYTGIKSQLSESVRILKHENMKTNRQILSNLQSVIQAINACPVVEIPTIVAESNAINEPPVADHYIREHDETVDKDVSNKGNANAAVDASNNDDGSNNENDEQLNINNISFVTTPDV